MKKAWHKFMTWLNDPKCAGTGVRMNDWLTDEEKAQYESEPNNNNNASLTKWLSVAYHRKGAEQSKREFVKGAFIMLATASAIGLVVLIDWALK